MHRLALFSPFHPYYQITRSLPYTHNVILFTTKTDNQINNMRFSTIAVTVLAAGAGAQDISSILGNIPGASSILSQASSALGAGPSAVSSIQGQASSVLSSVAGQVSSRVASANSSANAVQSSASADLASRLSSISAQVATLTDSAALASASSAAGKSRP